MRPMDEGKDGLHEWLHEVANLIYGSIEDESFSIHHGTDSFEDGMTVTLAIEKQDGFLRAVVTSKWK